MLILLSPAKTLDFDHVERNLPATKPVLHAEAKKLASVAKELSERDIAKTSSFHGIQCIGWQSIDPGQVLIYFAIYLKPDT